MIRSKFLKTIFNPQSTERPQIHKTFSQSAIYGIITENGIPDIDKALLASDLNSRIHLVKELHAGSSMVGVGDFQTFLNEAITSKG